MIIKEIWRSNLGKVGLVLFSLLILVSLYVWLTFPKDFGKKVWNNPDYWADYPKNAPPSWTRFFGKDKPVQRIFESSEASRVYQFETDSFSSLSLSVSEVVFWQAPPVIEIYLGKTGEEILIYHQSILEPRESDTKPVVRYRDFPLRIKLDYSSDDQASSIRVIVHTADERDRVGKVKLVVGGEVFGVLGTDGQGRDIFRGILYGLPIALIIALSVAVGATVIGATVAGVSGYYGGKIDNIIQRIIDVKANIPLFPILIFLIFVLGSHLLYIVLILTIFGWAGISIKLRSWILQIRTSGFVEYARAMGLSPQRIIFRHILVQTMPYILVSIVMAVPMAILSEAGLSFLGLGDSSLPTWGQMLEQSSNTGAVFLGYWWQVLPPGLAIIGTILVFWFLLQALEPIVEPRLKGG